MVHGKRIAEISPWPPQMSVKNPGDDEKVLEMNHRAAQLLGISGVSSRDDPQMDGVDELGAPKQQPKRLTSAVPPQPASSIVLTLVEMPTLLGLLMSDFPVALQGRE